ncbi:MAG: BatD family protein, partial [Syntrophothermus sp.]
MLKQKIKSLLFLLLCIAGSISAQSFTASVNNTTVAQNEPFQVAFQFNGEDINSLKNFRAPDFRGFRILSGPNQSTSMQIINGAVSGSISYSYYVQAPDQGTFVIGPASIDYKGKNFKSQAIKITVQKGQPAQQGNKAQGGNSSSGSVNLADNVFLKAVADKQRVTKGEQVTVSYKLYTRYDIASPQISKLPTYQGFWSEELENASRINFSTEVVNGKQYHVATLKKAALFPTQTGELSVTPFELKIPVVVPKQRQRRSGDIFDEFFNDPFFNQSQTVEYNAKSNTLKISVLPIPSDNVPMSFKGAIGEYSLFADVDKKTLKANETVTLKINISGTGNLNLVDVPDVKLPAGFEKYDPKTNTAVNHGSGVINGQKTFEFLMIPRVAGAVTIPPVEFSYYSLKQKKYVTLRSPEFALNVEKGDGSQGGSAVASGYGKEDVKLLGEDIRFIKTSVSPLSRQNDPAFLSVWFWLASALPLIALGAVIAWKKKYDRLSGNAQLMRYQKAEKMARNRL